MPWWLGRILVGPALGGLALTAASAGSLEGATTRAFMAAAGLGGLLVLAAATVARRPG